MNNAKGSRKAMKEVIESFGLKTFIIIFIIVIIILIALIGIIVAEKISIHRQKKPTLIDDSFDVLEEDTKEDKIAEKISAETLENTQKIEFIKQPEEVEILYEETTKTKEEAKKELAAATKKLVEESKQDLIGPTHFEIEQEEKSIISYDELKQINYSIDEVNDALLEDQGNEPITIEELYQSHLKEQETDEETTLENPIFVDTMEDVKKFKNSDVISPVYGIKKEQERLFTKETFEDTMDLQDLELEIKKTEEFLKELKKLKNKLN